MNKSTVDILNKLNESSLNEKINKNNIEINKAIANPNLGKNRDKIKAAGYETKEYDGKVYNIKNTKTGKSVSPEMYNKDEKKKVDFKGKLDSERPYKGKVSVYSNYAGKGKDIPSRAIVGKKDKNSVSVDAEEFDAYSKHQSISDDKPNYKSISKNVNDYKNAVKNRDEKTRWAKRNREGLGYYEDRVKKAQDDLDREKKSIDRYEKEAKDSENERKEILSRVRAKKNESALTEDEDGYYTVVIGFGGYIGAENEYNIQADSKEEAVEDALEEARDDLEVISVDGEEYVYEGCNNKSKKSLKEGEAVDYEDKLKELYQSYKNDGMEDSFWTDLMNAIDNTEYLDKWYESLDEGSLKEYNESCVKSLNEDLVPVSELPDMCYGVLPSDASIIIIKKGEKGYYPTNKGYEREYADIKDWNERNDKADEICNKLNDQLGVTPEQRMSMELRSMNGNWSD